MNDNYVPDPTTILACAAKAYAQCATYQDHGFVETTFHSGMPTEMKSKVWFTTFFKRPNSLRFAFMIRMMDSMLMPELINVIWTDGKTTHFKSPIWPFDRESSLEMAIAGATGISNRSAHTVPCLLMPEVGGHKVTDIKQTEFVSTETIDGELSDLIQKREGSTHSEFWISRSRSIIIRIQERNTIGPNMSPLLNKNNAQIQSFAGFLSWSFMKLSEGALSKMLPMPVTTNTLYQKVLLNEPIPDACFSEHGRL